MNAPSFMRSAMIEAGTPDQIRWDHNTWIIWDVGFGEDVKSSGLLMPCSEPGRFRFERPKQLIVEHIKNSRALTNLVIEAPLSVCFNQQGNPTPRKCVERVEIDGKIQSRPWYQAGGIMIAAMHLIRAIAESDPKAIAAQALHGMEHVAESRAHSRCAVWIAECPSSSRGKFPEHNSCRSQ
jgi:hypothetical protein